MSHQRVKDIWEELVDKSVLLAQNATSVDVLMFQKCICTGIPTLHDAMEDGMPPAEVVKKIDGRW